MDKRPFPPALSTVLFLMGGIPPLFFVPGELSGRYVFTLYREPKLYVISVFVWLLFSLGVGSYSFTGIALSLMGLLSLLSLLWAPVKEAVLYEVFQYVNLAIFAFFASYIFSLRKFRMVFLAGLLCGMILAVFIGIIQWMGISFEMLIPIGISYPSTFGARHCAGLATCGVLFLLLIPLLNFIRKRRYLIVVLISFVFFVFVFYILVLGSRTAYLGLMLGFLVLSLLVLIYGNMGWKRILCLVLVSCVLALSLIVTLSDKGYVRSRIEGTVTFLSHPLRILDTERWTWWRNSLEMFMQRPMGVGAGNWAFVYPISRRIDRNNYFTDDVQVRRAHNDYIQILCELGPVGLLLFLSIFIWSFRCCVGILRRGDPAMASVLLAQIVAWIGLLMFDYPFEMPFQRFLLVSVFLFVEGSYREIVA